MAEFRNPLSSHAFHHYLHEKDRMKNSGNKWQHRFFVHSGTVTEVRGQIWPNFELIQALMYVIVTCKYEKDPHPNDASDKI